MNDEKHPRPGQQSREEFERHLAAKHARKLRAMRQRDRNAWFGLGMFGLVGWSVAIPAVALTALGVWIDARSSAPYSWTLMLLVIGVAVGCVNAWFWISRERRDIEEQRRLPPEEETHDED
jgi:ATP synthase protein I